MVHLEVAVRARSFPCLRLVLAACAGPVIPASSTSSLAKGGRRADVSEPYVDEAERVEPIALTPLFDGTEPPTSFPKGTSDDHGCLAHATLTADRMKDYEAVVAACGAATGLREYAKPVTGKLHYVHDQRDTYSLPLVPGFCYRFFAVGDPTIFDLGVRVNGPDGARASEDHSSSPVALIESDVAVHHRGRRLSR